MERMTVENSPRLLYRFSRPSISGTSSGWSASLEHKHESAMKFETGEAPLIVCIGRDPMLLFTRGKILSGHGYHVTIGQPEMIFSRLDSTSPSLFIFCQTIPREVCDALAVEIKLRYPAAKMLLLIETPSERYDEMLFSSTFRPLEGPEALLSKTREMLAVSADQSIPS